MTGQLVEPVNRSGADAPDDAALGFVDELPDPLRYATATRLRGESSGMLCDRIPRGARVLDIGCGTGSISTLIATECEATVIGVEPDAQRASRARALGLEVHEGLYDQELASKLGRFDVILFADVLEHLADPRALLRLAARQLTPHGRVLASIPNVAHWTVRSRLLVGQFDYASEGIMDATHLRWFTRRTVRTLFGSAGLAIEELAATNGAWLPAYGWLPRRGRGRVLRALVTVAPSLFACQHIVVARAGS